VPNLSVATESRETSTASSRQEELLRDHGYRPEDKP
jgi:hypothetical protein